MDINRYTPSYGISRKDLIKLDDYSTEEIFEILYATKAMKSKYIAHEDTRILKGATVALLFGDTSLRTRSAIEIGVRQLGGTCVDLPYNEKDMHAGDNFKDIVQVIARYGVEALVARGIKQSELEEICSVSPLSILNSTNDYGRPLQALCDMFTIWEKKGRLDGLKIAYVGKGKATAASLVTCAVKCGMEVAVATPEQYRIDENLLNDVRQYGNVYETDNPVEAVKGADIIYTDNYSYHRALDDKERAILAPYQVNNSLLSITAHNALFMHPLPAKRGVEVTAEIIDGKSSIVLEQAENKLHTLKAIFALLIK